MRAAKRMLQCVALGLLSGLLGMSATLAEEPLAIVMAAGARPGDMDKDDLAAIFGRKRRFWEDGTRIDPVNLLASDPRRRQFSLQVFGLAPDQMEAYWNEMYFHGIQPPYVVSSVEAVLRYVSMTRGAIGYVPLCSADGRVTVLFSISEQGDLVRKPSVTTCHPGRADGG